MTSSFGNDAESRLQRSLQALRREVTLVLEGRSDLVPRAQTHGNQAPGDQVAGGSFEDTVRKAIARLTELFGIRR